MERQRFTAEFKREAVWLMESGDKAEALRLSKLELIQEGLYDRPYYWAPFILIGRPGSNVTLHHFARQ